MNNHTTRISTFLGPEFNTFLFESIGCDNYGRPLSVVSALARLDLDAWAEAANLARLPKDVATEKLSALIGKFTECPQAVKDAHIIAVRLVGLLPGRASVTAPHMPILLSPPRAEKIGRSAVAFVLIAILLIGTDLLAPRTHPAASPAAARAPVTATVSTSGTPQQ